MNFKKLANKKYEEAARYTSRDFLGRMPASIRREKYARNRAAKREVARRDIGEQLQDLAPETLRSVE